MFQVTDNGRYLYLCVEGKLTHEDYIQFLIPSLEEAINKYGKLRLMMEIENFSGWELQAAWDDLNVGIKHRKNFERIAIIGDAKWQELMTKIFGFFITGETKYFPIEEKNQAEDWVSH
ncbi:STAS/SEC14 domain-containing protein [Thiotrichales bacterium 19S9-12]|nr:STAS/SEC14 domain-containing protein [Thiotrichales bacterium 19S9-11]MCF6811689.1 STAS/SEC14 domain-containing protein [Thiotrichales bacterium 19S9-12]